MMAQDQRLSWMVSAAVSLSEPAKQSPTAS